MRGIFAAGAILIALLPTQASAGMFDGAGTLAKLMAQYKGRPAQELVDALGDATDQKQVLDNTIISGGFDSDNGPSCTWKIVVDKSKLVKDVSVFGNPLGCGPEAKNLKRYMRDHPFPEMQAQH